MYAGTRQPLAHSDSLVTPVSLDVTNAAQIQRAADEINSLDILINNAGIALYDDLSNSDAIEQSLAVNLYGPFNVTRTFLPLLRRSKGAIVNNLSLMALAPLPITPAYAISKAAAFNMTQSLRALLAGQGVTVHGVFLGPVTDMTRGFEIPKASPESVAVGIFDGLEMVKRISSPIQRRSPSRKDGALAWPQRRAPVRRVRSAERCGSVGVPRVTQHSHSTKRDEGAASQSSGMRSRVISVSASWKAATACSRRAVPLSRSASLKSALPRLLCIVAHWRGARSRVISVSASWKAATACSRRAVPLSRSPSLA